MGLLAPAPRLIQLQRYLHPPQVVTVVVASRPSCRTFSTATTHPCRDRNALPAPEDQRWRVSSILTFTKGPANSQRSLPITLINTKPFSGRLTSPNLCGLT